jgi:hypothetical protein
MGGSIIDWHAFDWQSFATLATGFFAVSAALVVGWRQAGILDRQSAIQELALKTDLFDRRYKVFERTKNFLGEILVHDDDPSPETRREFQIAMGESSFLFSPKVREGLDEIWKHWTRYHEVKIMMNHSQKTQANYREGDPEKNSALLQWFSSRSNTLPDLFGEMILDGTKLQK